MSAVRVGLRPTSTISMRDPGSAAAATIQNAAEEKSPGMASVVPWRAGVRRGKSSVR